MPLFLLVLWTMTLGTIVITFERRFAPALVGFALGLALAAALPSWRTPVLSGVNAIFLVNVLAVWRPQEWIIEPPP